MKEISILNSTEEFNHFKAAILSADWQVPFEDLLPEIYSEIWRMPEMYDTEKLEIKKTDENFDFDDFVRRKIDPNEMEKSRLFR